MGKTHSLRAKRFRNIDPWIVLPYVTLCIIGIIMVFSASAAVNMQTGGSAKSYLVKQTIFVILGLAVARFMSVINLKKLRNPYFLAIFAGILFVMLVFVRVFGASINGARGWISLGAFSIQPAEVVKLFLILYLSNQFAHYNAVPGRYGLKQAAWPLGLTGFLLIGILIQPDVGGVAINLTIAMVLFLGSEIDWKTGSYVIVLGVGGLILFLPSLARFLATHLHNYQANRFVAYLDPFGTTSGVGNQLVNSYYAISNGGLFGVGLGNSVQKMGYLPEPNTDFILAVISEELGFVMVAVILVLLCIIVCRCIRLGMQAGSMYLTLICYGVATFIAVETFFNVGGVCGLLPITGVTLPFISYGGSSMMILSAAIGLVLNVSRRLRAREKGSIQ
ncbi:FtsW/RodA/SpoVE family cell cycle protein [Limosilactobacillus secaliphilus]|uniref:FtsW/RodA/SpoVE family cell cycle protein n=1 Tax=Limosilactobacillus secaliphilus TaxID=396268 RepID=UPI00070D955C|nr:FtsW/RodA/SpoVE family cell cycle protein [Limosilactobacillus secaliphilus]